MLINNIDIKKFNATHMATDIQNSKQSSNLEVFNNSMMPILISTKKDLKEIKVTISFKGNSRDEILDNISNLMAHLNNKVTLKLDGYKKIYTSFLISDEIKKTPDKRRYKLLLIFKGYAEGSEITEIINRATTKTINVSGNQLTPSIVEITPISDIIDITLEGLDDDPIIIKNLKANKKVILDGVQGLVTVDGVNKYGDTDMWDFPRLKPGANVIKISRNSCDINIKYNPRFI